jgi:hypothetical protein
MRPPTIEEFHEMGDEDDYRQEIEDYAVHEAKLIGVKKLNTITRKLAFESWHELYEFLEIGPHHPLAHVLLFMTRQHRITLAEVKSAAECSREFGAAYLRVQATRSTVPDGGWPRVSTLIRTISGGSTLEQIAQDTSLGLFMVQAIVADYHGDCLHNPALPLQRLYIFGPALLTSQRVATLARIRLRSTLSTSRSPLCWRERSSST